MSEASGSTSPVAISGAEVVKRFEDVLTANLGEVGLFLLHQQLSEMGYTRDTFDISKSGVLIGSIKEEFTKIIGYSVDRLEMDLRRVIRE
jgi:hypothetical protein